MNSVQPSNFIFCILGIITVFVLLPNGESARATELIFRKTTTEEPAELDDQSQVSKKLMF